MIVIHNNDGEIRHVLIGGRQYTPADLLALITEHAALIVEVATLKQERDGAYRTTASWKVLAMALARRQKRHDEEVPF